MKDDILIKKFTIKWHGLSQLSNCSSDYNTFSKHEMYICAESHRGLVVRAKYFGISHAGGHRFRTAVSKA